MNIMLITTIMIIIIIMSISICYYYDYYDYYDDYYYHDLLQQRRGRSKHGRSKSPIVWWILHRFWRIGNGGNMLTDSEWFWLMRHICWVIWHIYIYIYIYIFDGKVAWSSTNMLCQTNGFLLCPRLLRPREWSAELLSLLSLWLLLLSLSSSSSSSSIYYRRAGSGPTY